MKYHYAATIPSAGEDAEKLDLSQVVGGTLKFYSHPGKWFGDFFKRNLNVELYVDPGKFWVFP